MDFHQPRPYKNGRDLVGDGIAYFDGITMVFNTYESFLDKFTGDVGSLDEVKSKYASDMKKYHGDVIKIEHWKNGKPVKRWYAGDDDWEKVSE